MTAGLFQGLALYMGDNHHAPTPENPTGYFEDPRINTLNNQILGALNPEREVIDGQAYRSDSPGMRNGWLSRIPLSTPIQATPAQEAKIREIVAHEAFCLKDPRFCYLLHLWRAHAPGARMICVFRPPQISAASLLKSCRIREGLHDMAVSVQQAFEVWRLMYLHVLEHHARQGEWFFVDYADILNGSAMAGLRAFTGLPLDAGFAQKTLNRTSEEFSATPETRELYERLRERAAETREIYG